MEAIRDLGAYAGLAAFVGLAVLALLYFAQARDVRRLRENAEFLVDPDAAGAAPPPIGAEGEAAQTQTQTRPASDAEAFRRSELARQAADRRQRFEERRTGGGGGRFPDFPSTAIIVIGALILLAGIGFGASKLLGGDDGTSGGGASSKEKLACPPGQTQVAVLNGTAEAGLAATSAKDLEQKGYEVRPVTNTGSPFDTTVVMFDQGSQDCAADIAPVVGVQGTQAMDPEIRGISEGAQVAVVLGEDRVTGSSASSGTDTSGTLGD